MFVAKFSEAASKALTYLRQRRGCKTQDINSRDEARESRFPPVGWTLASPVAVLRRVGGFFVDVHVLPYALVRQGVVQKVQQHVRDFPSRRQDSGQLGLVVAREAKAPSWDDRDAQAQANFITDSIMLAKQQQQKKKQHILINRLRGVIKWKKKWRDTHSTNWKVANVQEGPNMMHPISPLFCKQQSDGVRLQCAVNHAPNKLLRQLHHFLLFWRTHLLVYHHSANTMCVSVCGKRSLCAEIDAKTFLCCWGTGNIPLACLLFWILS